jgi:hypothetical protein
MSLAAKLKFQPGKPLWLLHSPDALQDEFVEYDLRKRLNAKDEVGQVLFFVTGSHELNRLFPLLVEKMADDVVCWAAYPKKSSGIESDLIRDAGWDIITASGYQFVTSISINAEWTGMRIRKHDPNAVYKRSVPMEERKTEGIDYVNRTVQLPEDALMLMKPFKGLDDFFNHMSFSHKREYVEAIVEAKKAETRQRRIEKMIDALVKMRKEKELKKKR